MINTLTYRPEVDGLRAVAVMLVILHHLGLSVIPGGYVGVDVFFVISGYLITSIVVGEIKGGRFAFGNFYKRRIIRLAPAYFLMLAVTSLASMVVMMPAELLAYFKSVIYSTLFAANFFMWHEVGGYFGVSGVKVPLLHLWSLAVEEQFYIFWPLTLLLLYKIVKSNYIWLIVAVVALAFLGLSEWGANNYRAASYYLMPTRAFEFLVGALVTLIPRLLLQSKFANGITILGLVLIIVPATRYSTESFFPGIKAFVPCIGTFLILAFAGHQNNLVGRALATPLLNFLGKISYPAYLWHWPVLVILKIQLIEITAFVAVGVLATTLLLSVFTYYFVEKPFKRWALAFKFDKVACVGLALPAIAFLFFAILAYESKGWPTRFDESLNVKSAAVLSSSSKIRGRCNEGNVKNPLPSDECILGVHKPDVDILLIGDSHANHFTGMIDVMAKDAGLRGYDVTQAQTLYLPEVDRFYLRDNTEVKHENFSIRNRVLQENIQKGGYRFVVLAGSFAINLRETVYSLNDDRKNSQVVFHKQFEKAIVEIMATSAVPVIIKGNPVYTWAVQDCTLNNQRFNLKNNCDMTRNEYESQFKDWDKFLKQLVKNFPSIIVIDPALVICNESSCLSELKGIPIYRDYSHLNDIGSRLIGDIYIREFGNPFKESLVENLHATSKATVNYKKLTK